MSESRPTKKKEIYTYESDWNIYAMSWSNRRDIPFRFALGSYHEDRANSISVVRFNQETEKFDKISDIEHKNFFPATKLMWKPSTLPQGPDLLASSSDYLHIHQVENDQLKYICSLNKNKSFNEFCAPITSFDWNEINLDYIGAASIDTTCTIWNVTTQQVLAQLIAHDKGVFDIAFSSEQQHVFTSAGEDGSVRMFDLRALDHSTIIYESPDDTPLLRLAWNKKDPNFIATFMMNDTAVIILDIRFPSVPAFKLEGHQDSLNAFAWAPHSSKHICTAGDDKQTMIWELDQQKELKDPILTYQPEEEVNQIQWSISDPRWIGISYGKKMQILRV